MHVYLVLRVTVPSHGGAQVNMPLVASSASSTKTCGLKDNTSSMLWKGAKSKTRELGLGGSRKVSIMAEATRVEAVGFPQGTALKAPGQGGLGVARAAVTTGPGLDGTPFWGFPSSLLMA